MCNDHFRKLKVLTVGDGDLSLSLALSRAYGHHIDLTASVLETDELNFLTVFQGRLRLQELKDRNVSVEWNVDATQLHTRFQNTWDLVCFHHPHLGISNLENENESERARIHHRLLCHYFHSASLVCNNVHVCLTHTQPITWNLFEAAEHQNLTLIKKLSDSTPFANLWDNDDNNMTEPAQIKSHFAAPRRYRNGKVSRHFLGRYGYQHRRTEGDLFEGSSRDVNVSTSMHYVFTVKNKRADVVEKKNEKMMCMICNEVFNSEVELKKHLASPVRPKPTKTNIDSSDLSEKKNVKRTLEYSNEIQQHNQEDSSEFMIVPKIYHGRRLRWFLHHSKTDVSKRFAEKIIREGLVSINGKVAVDSGRILKEHDKVGFVCVTKAEGGGEIASSWNVIKSLKPRNNIKIEIVKRLSSLLVAFKPSGMRTKGDNSGTLEKCVSDQEGESFMSLSSLETSCPGLCVLVTSSTLQSHRHNSRSAIRHFLTILVHGKLPAEWYPSRKVQLVVAAKWRQKKMKKERQPSSTSKLEEKLETVSVVPKESIELSTEQHRSDDIALTTLEVITSEPSSSRSCQFFRQEGFPVVGDSFCKQEYANLKRSIKNRLKNKLCIGCFKVEVTIRENNSESNDAQGRITTHVIEYPIPDKLSAKYWEQFLLNVSHT